MYMHVPDLMQTHRVEIFFDVKWELGGFFGREGGY